MNKFDTDKARREIDLYLSSLDDVSEDTEQLATEFKAITAIINNSKYPQAVIDLVNKYYDYGNLTPLDLSENNFILNESNKIVHNRCESIEWFSDFNNNIKILYHRAWKPNVKHVYRIETNEEEELFPTHAELPDYEYCPIYITRGGVCNGEYISEIYLKRNTVDNNRFWPGPAISLPVSLQIGSNYVIWSVDAREPKLKALRQFYNTTEVKLNDYKFDIRKYKKLNKNDKS